MTDLTAGAKAPSLKLWLSDGDGMREAQLPPAGTAVVFFFPRVGSSTCTNEVLGFDARADDFRKLGVTVLGVSPDAATALARFRQKHGISLALASDPDLAAAKAWGTWIEKQMYGRTFMGVERATFLVRANGRIAAAWRKVRLAGHVEAVLEAVARSGAAV